MSFPGRTAFYHRGKGEIYTPAEARNLDNDYIREVDGSARSYVENFGYTADDNLIPIASTGLEDSEGNEIFEGHLLCDGESHGVVVWSHGQFLLTFDCGNGFANELLTETHSLEVIDGHVLTDPELVPDSFDVHEYFDIPTEGLSNE